MAVLRLFAAAREAAGTTSVEVPGRTVDDVLSAARARFGADFAAVLDAAAVWRNGEPAAGSDPVAAGDEVAVLPPVSGGADDAAGSDAPPPAAGRSVIRRSFNPAPPPAAAAPGSSAAPERSRTRPSAEPRTRPSAEPRRAEPRPAEPRRSEPRRAAGGTDDPPARTRAPRTPPPARIPAPATTPAPEVVPPPLERTPLTRTPTITGAPIDEDNEVAARSPRVLSRVRTVAVPVTGHVTIRGRKRAVAGPRPRKTAFGRRYAVVYDTDGWKVTFGVAWFVAVLACLATGWAALTFVYGVAAGWAAMEATLRWRERGVAADPWVAAAGAAAIAAAAAAGTSAMGVAILVTVVVSVAYTAFSGIHRHHSLSAAGNTVGCAVPFGLAAGCVVLTRDLEIGAAVVLILFVAAYEAGDYLIGSGSSNSIEGPLTGIVTIAVVAMVVAVLRVPPFDGTPALAFAAAAAVLCPAGQLAASAILPAADAHAPSVRRIDSLLILAPVWVWAVGVFIDAQA